MIEFMMSCPVCKDMTASATVKYYRSRAINEPSTLVFKCARCGNDFIEYMATQPLRFSKEAYRFGR